MNAQAFDHDSSYLIYLDQRAWCTYSRVHLDSSRYSVAIPSWKNLQFVLVKDSAVFPWHDLYTRRCERLVVQWDLTSYRMPFWMLVFRLRYALVMPCFEEEVETEYHIRLCCPISRGCKL